MFKAKRKAGNDSTVEQSETKKPKSKARRKMKDKSEDRPSVFSKIKNSNEPGRVASLEKHLAGEQSVFSQADEQAGDLEPSVPRESVTGSSTDEEKENKKKRFAEKDVVKASVHKRRIRLTDEVKPAKKEEVDTTVKTSIFMETESADFDKDYIAPTEEASEGLLIGQPDYAEIEDTEDEPLKLSKEIADAFGIKKIVEPEVTEEDTATIFAAPEEAEEKPKAEIREGLEKAEIEEKLEEAPEEECYSDGTVTVDVLGRLVTISDEYFCKQVFSESGKCLLVYSDESVDSVIISDDLNIQLPNYHVYVDGKLQEWDSLFEVKIPTGSLVEVETGVRIIVPGSVKVKLAVANGLMDKYSLKLLDGGKILSENDLKEPVVMSFEACEGAYLSKIGRVVECQLEE